MENSYLEGPEDVFRRIFESIPDLFFLVSSDTTVLDYKGKEEDLYLKPKNFLGKKLKDLLPDDIGKRIFNAIKKTIELNQPQILEYSLLIKSKLRYFEARILYFFEDQVAIFIREITKRKEAEKIIKEEFEKLKELEQIRKDLISRVSHEIKTPLMSIRGASELISEYHRAHMGKELLELIEMIQKGGRRLEHLVNNLLDISRIEYNKLLLNKKKENLSEIIKGISSEIKILIEGRGIELNLKIPESLYLEIDRIRIEQVIINLLTNAMKNTPKNGKIDVIVRKAGDMAEISVSDTGVGFTKKEMDRLFTRFGKIERYGSGLEYLNIQGSGLGLFISKEIIEFHGGKIWVISKGRHEGCTFTVKLPIT